MKKTLPWIPVVILLGTFFMGGEWKPKEATVGPSWAQIKFEYSEPVKTKDGKFESTAAIKSETGTQLDIKAVSSDTVTVSEVRQDGNNIWIKVSPVTQPREN